MPKPATMSYLTSLRWTTEDARAAIAALTASRLSIAAFATRTGLDAQRLYRWHRRLADDRGGRESAPDFVELRPRESERVEVVLRTGRVLRVSEEIGASALERFVAVLERVAC